MHELAAPQFHFLTRVVRRSPSMVIGPCGRPRHVLVHSLARHRPGPRVAPTCFAPFRVPTLFQAEATPQPRSERASSTRCHVCVRGVRVTRGMCVGVGLTRSLLAGARPVDRVLPARCRAAGTRDPTGPGRPEHERGGPGRTQGAASVPPCEARTAREVDSATAAGSMPPGTHTSPAPGSRSPRPQLAVSHARAPYGKIQTWP